MSVSTPNDGFLISSVANVYWVLTVPEGYPSRTLVANYHSVEQKNILPHGTEQFSVPLANET